MLSGNEPRQLGQETTRAHAANGKPRSPEAGESNQWVTLAGKLGHTTFEELYENEDGELIANPRMVSRPKLILTEGSKINRVFYFLAFTSTICLVAVMVAPRAEVHLVAIAIWGGSIGLARYLLRRAYRGKP